MTCTDFVADHADAIPRPFLAKCRDWLHVGDFPVTGNGTSNDQDGLEKAFAAAQALDKVLVMPGLPAGAAYRATEPLVTNGSLRVMGEGFEAATHFLNGPADVNPRGGGTFLHFDHAGIGIRFDHRYGHFLRDIATVRSQPAPGPGFSPGDFDFDLELDGCGLTIENVTLVNPTRGLRVVTGGAGWLSAHTLRGQPLKVGIEADQVHHLLHLEGVEWWPWWSWSSHVWDWMKANAVAFDLARVDGPILRDCFSIFYNVGLKVRDTGFGTVNRLMGSALYFDRGGTGVQVESSGFTGQITNLVTLCEAPGNTCGVLMLGSGNALEIANYESARSGANAIRNVEGSNNRIAVTNGKFGSWGMANPAFPAIEDGGSNGIELMLPTFMPHPSGGQITGV